MDSGGYWSIERRRILLVLFITLLGGLISGYWLAAFTVSLLGYIAWMLFKLQQLQTWLGKGGKPRDLPDSNGIWEHITQHIQRLQKGKSNQKKRVARMLKRFRGIITGLPYATIVLNRNNEIDWANKTAGRYLGIDIKRDRGQRIENLVRLPILHEMLEQKPKSEIEVALPGGDGRQLAMQLIPVQKDLKLLIVRDISERVRTQQMRKAFIANASHELRTPLTVISGYLEIMQADDTLPQHLKKAVDAAASQSGQMRSIIEDLLMLSRLENPEPGDADREIVDVPAIIETVCHDHAGLGEETEIRLECSIDPNLKIRGVETEVLCVCNNLISNAIRHTPPGTPINVSWQRNGGEACMVVTDQGEGIAPEHLSRLTERFYRVDRGRSREQGGTGLGLAIVQHIMQRHQGCLKIESKLGEGSTFSACFPEPVH